MQSVMNALRILEHVSEERAVGVTDVSRALDLPKSTVQRTLTALGRAGWIRQDPQARWELTLQCAAVGRRVGHEPAVRAAAHPVAVELQAVTHETVRYFLIDGETFVLLETIEGDHTVRPVEADVAGRIPMNAAAVGKAVLAAWSDDAVDRYLEHPLERLTPATVVDPDVLRAHIRDTRRRGYGEVREETYLDVGGVAAVAQLPDGMMVGIGISFPLHRTSSDAVARYGELVREGADWLSNAIVSADRVAVRRGA
jgi:IclR family transcriptional regulator, acetate operon repressor